MTTKCSNCGDESSEPLHLCATCTGVASTRLAEFKLRLSGDVDWEDIKRYGIYDRFGVPIATVQRIEWARTAPTMLTTGPHTTTVDRSIVVVYCTPLKKR